MTFTRKMRPTTYGRSCIFLLFTTWLGTSHPQQSTPLTDQVNTEGWDGAWTNLVNDVQQTFKPALPRLEAVEVDLVLGNPGKAKERLILTILDSNSAVLSTASKIVQSDKCDRVVFVIPNGGVEVTPGETYALKLSGGTTFGWKYIVGGYEKGAATFNGRPLVPSARSTFLFRTFGSK